MFLYDKHDENIDVFLLLRKEQSIKDYRKEQMETIPLKERCMYTKEIVSNPNSIPVLLRKDLDLITMEELTGNNKALEYNDDMEDCSDLLQHFYNNEYVNSHVARVELKAKLMYLLIASNYIISKKENGKLIMKVEDIINLPKSLYLLQLLEQEKFSLIAGEDLSEQLDLFDFCYVNNISLKELQKTDACGITKGAYLKTINKSNNDKYILQLLKK